MNYFTLSRESATCRRSPAISSAAFDARPPDLPPTSLMDTDFVVSCQLVRRRKPLIRFLCIGPHLCSTLPSDPTSRWRPCASLPFTSIRLEQDFHLRAAEHARRNRDRGNDRSFSPPTPPGMRVRTGRFRKIEPLRAGGPIHRFATRASPLDRLPFRLHRLLNLKSSAVADWLAQCHS